MEEFHPNYYFNLQDYEHKDLFNNCEFVWDVLPAIQVYLQKFQQGIIETHIPETAILVKSELIFIGKGTIVEPGAYIEGPCIIGENCQIRNGAYIRGNFICGNNCVIGHATEIKNSVFLDTVQAAHFSYIGDSVLGNKSHLGAGTKCANLRFDKRPVRLFFNGRTIDTGLRKFGAIFGDFSQSGCNSVTNPGTLVGKRSIIAPCSNAKGVIREGRMVLMDGSIEAVAHY